MVREHVFQKKNAENIKEISKHYLTKDTQDADFVIQIKMRDFEKAFRGGVKVEYSQAVGTKNLAP